MIDVPSVGVFSYRRIDQIRIVTLVILFCSMNALFNHHSWYLSDFCASAPCIVCTQMSPMPLKMAPMVPQTPMLA